MMNSSEYTPNPVGESNTAREHELSPEQVEHQKNHEEAVRALNAIGVPDKFTTAIRWSETLHSKAYNGMKTYGINYSDALRSEDSTRVEQQTRAHEMIHLYWSSLINPQLQIELPPEIDFGRVAQEHQGELEHWNVMQSTPKQLLVLSEYAFHHNLPGSADRAISAINEHPTEFLSFLRERCGTRVPFEYGLASTLEYLESIKTDDFYAQTGLGRSFEEGLVTYLSSGAMYGQEKEKWQVQEDERAMYYRNSLHEVFGSPDALLSFIHKEGIAQFVDKVRSEIQSGHLLKEDEHIPKTYTEHLLNSLYVLQAENKELWIDTTDISQEYKDRSATAKTFLETKLKNSDGSFVALSDLALILEEIEENYGQVRLSTNEQWAFLYEKTENTPEHPNEFLELLTAFGVSDVKDLLSHESSFLRNLTTKLGKNIPSDITDFSNVPSNHEIVSVLGSPLEESALGNNLRSLHAKLVVKIDPAPLYNQTPEYLTLRYQLVCHPDLAPPTVSTLETDTAPKKDGGDELDMPTELEQLSALVHVVQRGQSRDVKRFGPDDVPPLFKRFWKQPPHKPNFEREIELDPWEKARQLSQGTIELFTYMLEQREPTDAEWTLIQQRMTISEVELVIEMIRERKNLFTGTREAQTSQEKSLNRSSERLREYE